MASFLLALNLNFNIHILSSFFICVLSWPRPLNSHAYSVILMFSPPISRSHAQSINSHASDTIPLKCHTFISNFASSRQKWIETALRVQFSKLLTQIQSHNHNLLYFLLKFVLLKFGIQISGFLWNLGHKYHFNNLNFGTAMFRL